MINWNKLESEQDSNFEKIKKNKPKFDKTKSVRKPRDKKPWR